MVASRKRIILQNSLLFSFPLLHFFPLTSPSSLTAEDSTILRFVLVFNTWLGVLNKFLHFNSFSANFSTSNFLCINLEQLRVILLPKLKEIDDIEDGGVRGSQREVEEWEERMDTHTAYGWVCEYGGEREFVWQ